MSSQTTSERSRGRPREFDEDAVLDALVDLFWTKGYEATSLTDIVEAAGMNKSSLYNAFGCKEDIFHLALERYLEVRGEMMEQVAAGDRGIDDLLSFFDFIGVMASTPDGSRGCLAVNSATELGHTDPTIAGISAKYQSTMSEVVARPIRRAVDAGEIDPTMVDVYVNTCASLMVSLSVATRAGVGPDEVDRQVQSMKRLVETWRLP